MKRIVKFKQDKNGIPANSVDVVNDYIQDDEYYEAYGDFYYDVFVKQDNIISKVSFIDKSTENINYTLSSEAEYDIFEAKKHLEEVKKLKKIEIENDIRLFYTTTINNIHKIYNQYSDLRRVQPKIVDGFKFIVTNKSGVTNIKSIKFISNAITNFNSLFSAVSFNDECIFQDIYNANENIDLLETKEEVESFEVVFSENPRSVTLQNVEILYI